LLILLVRFLQGRPHGKAVFLLKPAQTVQSTVEEPAQISRSRKVFKQTRVLAALKGIGEGDDDPAAEKSI